ncbi:MAG TPA: TlpA disulfide reductase family protein [Pyrinomonadaceae bacterium]|jgi:thiol-disulfide isomerase/thioredoxin|nr:TlpA disulfide reductase family protein [Pyrinomonadaceae bacterium]
MSARTFVIVALLVVAVSSCRRTEETKPAGETAGKNRPVVTVKSEPGRGERTTSSNTLEPVADKVLKTKLVSIDGKEFQLGDYAGKVLVVNLWATWCGPCRQEVPHFVTMTKEYASKDVEIIGLTTEDPEEAKELVQNFMETYKINYKIGWAPYEFAAALARRDVIPQTYVITRDGNLLARFEGFNPQSTPPKLRAAIDQALSMSGKT